MGRGRISDMQRAVLGRRMVDELPRAEAPVDLRAEMLGNGLDYRACQRLEALGVPGKFVATLSAQIAIGQARVSVGREFWVPEGPDARLLLACHDEGGLCDIAAISTSAPDLVTLRRGAGWCLGFDQWDRADCAQFAEKRVRLRVFADALEWLKASGEGIVVLDWAEGVRRLRQLGERVTLECGAAMVPVLRAKLERGALPMIAAGAADGCPVSLAEKIGRAA